MSRKIRLGDIATVITKGTTPTTIGFSFVDAGINFVKIESISENGTLIPDKFAHITQECDQKLKRSRLEENDILFSIAGAIGRTAIVPKSILPANTNQALAIIRIPQDTINLHFVLYALQSQAVEEQSEKQKQGVAQLNLSLKNIADIEIPLVSSARQNEIVENLSAIDAAIAQRKEQLWLLDQLVKSRFIELFGDPITNSKGLKTNALKDVLVLKAGDFTAASDISDEQTAEYQYPCYGGNGIRGYVTEYNQEGAYSLIGRQGALSGNVQYAKGRFRNTEHALLVTPTVAMNSIWLNQLLINLDLKRYQTGAAQPGLSVKNLQEIPIISVVLSEQNAFAAFVEQTDKSKFLHYKALLCCRSAANLYRQEWMTCQTSVS